MWLQSLRQFARRVWIALTAVVLLALAFLRVSLSALKIALLVGVALALVVIVVGNSIFRGDRDIAYRFAAPDAPECMAQESMPIALSSEDSNRDNDELAAIERQPVLGRALTCMVQVHQVEAPKDKPEVGRAALLSQLPRVCRERITRGRRCGRSRAPQAAA